MMARKPMKDAQKYRKANARGAGPEAEGKAKIRTAAAIEKASAAGKRKASESKLYGLRTEGSRLLGQAYGRKVGDVGKPGYYRKGGAVKKSMPKGK